MGKKNIVIICFKYPPVYSGYGKQLKSVLEKILQNNKNFKFTILTAYQESLYANDCIKVIPLLSNYNKKSDLFHFSRKVLTWLCINRKKIDVIHCIKAGPEAVISNIISKLFRIPLVIKIAQDELSPRELEYGSLFKKKARKIRHKFLGTADHFIAISDEIDRNIRKNKTSKSTIHRIPNGVDTDKFDKIPIKTKNKERIKKGFSSKETIILFIGELNKRKGVPELIDSIDLIDTELPIRLVLCGPTFDEFNIHSYIEKSNKKSKNITIDYQGIVDNPNVYMQCADIFILPSHSEGLPNVLLEAASTALPLIATDIGGSNEILIENYNGYLIPVNNKKELANSLKKLITRDNVREIFGANSRQHILNKFSLDIVAKKYTELYNMIT